MEDSYFLILHKYNLKALVVMGLINNVYVVARKTYTKFWNDFLFNLKLIDLKE